MQSMYVKSMREGPLFPPRLRMSGNTAEISCAFAIAQSTNRTVLVKQLSSFNGKRQSQYVKPDGTLFNTIE